MKTESALSLMMRCTLSFFQFTLNKLQFFDYFALLISLSKPFI